MKILISGTTGFVGIHLVKRLTEAGHDVRAIVRPSSDTSRLTKEKIDTYVFGTEDGNVESLTSYMQKERFDGVIHLASLFLAQHRPRDVKSLTDSNVFFSAALLEAAVAAKTPWFINTGTFWQHYGNESYSPVNLYAATKQAFLDIASYYIEISDIDFVTIELGDMFGPGDETRKRIFNVWKNISPSGETLEMSPGAQQIDASHIDNIVDGYERMITLISKDAASGKRKLCGKSFVISSDEIMTLKELAEIFEEISGMNYNIAWGAREYRPREVMKTWNKGKKIPGWKPKISVREGVKKYLHDEER